MSDVARPELNGSRSPESGSPLRLARPEPGPPPVIPAVYRFVVNVTYLPVLASGMHLEVHGRGHMLAPGTPLADYLVPMSGEMPDIVIAHVETPVSQTLLGAKGIGEAGTIGAGAALANAVHDALSPWGVHLASQPYTPEKILRALGRVGTPS